jgi:thiol-disulfide isomerase/thioredoxin
MSRRRVPGAVAAAFLALGAVGCTARGAAVSTDSGAERFVAGDGVVTYVRASRREPAPALSGERLSDGASLSVPAGTGPAVVNVWGSWCAPCKAEQPVLESASRAYAARGVRFLGIDIREPGRTAPRLHVRKYGVTYPSLYDPSARLLTAFKIPAKTTPTTYVVDGQGRVAAYVNGAVEQASFTALLDRVLAES